MARPIGTATISFGLVNIPVQLFTAVSANRAGLNRLRNSRGRRLRQRMFCPIDNTTVDADGIVRGFEHTRDKFATFSEEELRALEAERSNLIELVEFVPENTVGLLYIESSRFLGPDRNAARHYALLFHALARSEKIAVGRHNTRGKTSLVLVRPFKMGLVLHEVFYADEVRSFADVPFATFDDVDEDLEAALCLMDANSSECFDPSKYKDTCREQVMGAGEQKIAGEPVTIQPAAPKTAIIDLLEALKRSVGHVDSSAANETTDEEQQGPRRRSERAPSPSAPGPAKTPAKTKSGKRPKVG